MESDFASSRLTQPTRPTPPIVTQMPTKAAANGQTTHDDGAADDEDNTLLSSSDFAKTDPPDDEGNNKSTELTNSVLATLFTAEFCAQRAYPTSDHCHWIVKQRRWTAKRLFFVFFGIDFFCRCTFLFAVVCREVRRRYGHELCCLGETGILKGQAPSSQAGTSDLTRPRAKGM